jgi:hypothetical protein
MLRYFVLPLLLALATPLYAAAAGGGTAEGKLTVDGKAFNLTYAYAINFKNDGFEYYMLVLIDAPLTDRQQRLFPDEVMIKQIKAGKVHALGLNIKASGGLTSVDIYNSEGWPQVQEEKKLQMKTLDGKTLAGRAYVDKPFRYVDGIIYNYDVKFSAPVRPESDFPL